MVIYVDMLLIVNGWVDFLLLLLVRRMAATGTPGRRLVWGALLGAAGSLILLLPALPVWITAPCKLVTAALMVWISFRWEGGRLFIRRLLLLFGVSAGLAGLCAALYYYVAPPGLYVFNGQVYYAVPPLWLVALTGLCYGLMRLWDWVVRRRAPAGREFLLSLTVGHHTVRVDCLYDSGNHLTEPFSGCPVVVIDRGALAGLLPLPTVEELPAGWRLIPYDSVGGSGVLPAFVPDGMTVSTPSGHRELPRCYVAVCDRLGRGEYRGLLGTALSDYLT